MTRMSSPGNSIPRQDVLDFLVRRAKNGAAIVYTEAIVSRARRAIAAAGFEAYRAAVLAGATPWEAAGER